MIDTAATDSDVENLFISLTPMTNRTLFSISNNVIAESILYGIMEKSPLGINIAARELTSSSVPTVAITGVVMREPIAVIIST